jgi:hypothetical protein
MFGFIFFTTSFTTGTSKSTASVSLNPPRLERHKAVLLQSIITTSSLFSLIELEILLIDELKEYSFL